MNFCYRHEVASGGESRIELDSVGPTRPSDRRASLRPNRDARMQRQSRFLKHWSLTFDR